MITFQTHRPALFYYHSPTPLVGCLMTGSYISPLGCYSEDFLTCSVCPTQSCNKDFCCTILQNMIDSANYGYAALFPDYWITQCLGTAVANNKIFTYNSALFVMNYNSTDTTGQGFSTPGCFANITWDRYDITLLQVTGSISIININPSIIAQDYIGQIVITGSGFTNIGDEYVVIHNTAFIIDSFINSSHVAISYNSNFLPTGSAPVTYRSDFGAASKVGGLVITS